MRVSETISPAWDTMDRLLFRPFNIGTWFSFGLLFGLQSCAEGGGGHSSRVPDFVSHGSRRSSGADDLTSDAISNVLPGHSRTAPVDPYVGACPYGGAPPGGFGCGPQE